MKKIVLSESSYDYKYQNIFSRISDVQVTEGKFIKLLKILIKEQSFYHIRYIKYRGFLLTTFRILLVSFLSKISRSKIIWTCHNIYEHNIPSKRFNDFLRYLLCIVSFKIIVLHNDLVRYIPRFAHKKVITASFGEFKTFIQSKHTENKEFWRIYQSWLKKRNIKNPDIISISAAKRNNLELLIKNIRNTEFNALMIAPNHDTTIRLDVNPNIIIYRDGFVEKEISLIFKNTERIIGYIGHDNISVPTSIYMYASYGIPIIGLNIEPVSTIINEYKIGEIINSDDNSLKSIIYKIQNNYKFYQNNCELFLAENSWEKSADIHKTIFLK